MRTIGKFQFAATLLGAFALGLTATSCSLDISKSDGKGTASSAVRAVEPTPDVTFTTPQRASFHAVGPVVVSGFVSQADATAPVTSLSVDGMVVPFDPVTGDFTTTVNLLTGLNIIRGQAIDVNGRMGSTEFAVLAGEWKPLNERIPAAIALRLNNPALDAVASIVEPLAANPDLTSLTADPIYDDVMLAGLVSARVDLANPRLSLVPPVRIFGAPDGLHLEIEIRDIYVDLIAEGVLFGVHMGPEYASVQADTALVTATIQLASLTDRALGASIVDSSVDFVNFQANFHPSSLMQMIMPLVRGWIETKVEELVEDLLLDAGADLNTSIAEALNSTVPMDLLGNPFLYDMRVDSLVHDSDGLELVLDLDLPAPQLTARGAAAPGSFTTPALLPASLTTQRGISISLDDDTLNRAFHVIWATGVLDLDVAGISALGSPTGTAPAGSGLSLGSNGAPMVVYDLAQFLPELTLAIDGSAVVDLKLEAGLPPLIEVTGSPDLMQLSLCELYLSILADDGSGPQLLTKIALSLRAGVTIAAGPTGLTLSSARRAEISIDVIEEPLVKINEDNLRVVLGTVLPPLLPSLINSMGVVPLPSELSHLTFFDLRATADINAGQRLMIEVDMLR